MASFSQPPTEKKMKNNLNYKGNGKYNANTDVPYKVDITPWMRDRNRPYSINVGTGEYAKNMNERIAISKKYGCDKHKKRPLSMRPPNCKWIFYDDWGKDKREQIAKNYRGQAQHKEGVSKANNDFLKKKIDDLSDFNREISLDNSKYTSEINRIKSYHYPEYKKIEINAEKNKKNAITDKNAAEKERDITYNLMLEKIQTKEEKKSEYSKQSEFVNNKIIDRDNKKRKIKNKLEDINVTQSNLLLEDQTLKDNWLLNYYYSLGNKRKQLTFGEFQKQNQHLEKKTNKLLKTNVLYDRDNMYLQEQNVYLLLFNRNGLILYYLLFLYFAYIFFKYRQDTTLQTKLLYLVPLSIFPFFIAIFIYVFNYVKILLK